MWVGYGIGFITGMVVMAGIEALLAEKWSRELGLEVEDEEDNGSYDVLNHSHCDDCDWRKTKRG